jgi:hypothetical protein
MNLLYKYITGVSLSSYTKPLAILFDIFEVDDSKNAKMRLGSLFDSSFKNATK